MQKEGNIYIYIYQQIHLLSEYSENINENIIIS